MGIFNIWNTNNTNKASLTFTGSSDVTVDSNNLSGLTGNVQTQLNKMLGVGQTWQDVTASRASGTTYTNTTGKPIMVSFWLQSSSSSTISITVNGNTSYSTASANGSGLNSFTIVPNGSTYSITFSLFLKIFQKNLKASTIIF